MPPASVVLHASHVSKNVRSGDSELSILKDINLSVQAGESIAITGTSGSGKTTLLSLLGGLDLPTSGELYFLNQALHKKNEEERAILRGHHIGFIFQSFQLLPTLSALENVMLPLEIQYWPQKEAKAKACEWLKQVKLEQRLHHYPTQLSGGEQQRVAIARAFVTQPQLILADEVTGNLDLETGKIIMDLMFSLNQKQQTTLVLVTHDEQLRKRCDHHYSLSKGKLQAC